MAKGKKNTVKKEFLSYPFLTLIVMFIITIGATLLFYQNAVNKDKVRFEVEVTERRETLENKISNHISLLKAARGYIQTNNKITRDNFKTFISSFDISEKFPSVQGVGYTSRIRIDERDSFIKLMNDDGYKSFKIFPDGEREELQTVTLLEPQDALNDKEIGFDMATDATRRKAMLAAKDSDKPTATAKTNLFTKNNLDKQGFLIYLPIYQNSNTTDITNDKDQLLRGYVFGSIRTDDFIEEIYKAVPNNNVGVLIYDGEIKSENLLASTERELDGTNSSWLETDKLDVAGREWIVQYKSLPKFSTKSDVRWTLIVPICGALLTILLFGLTYSEANTRLKFENTASELSLSESEKNKLLISEKKAREHAEKSNKIKDEFLSIISHELRTPLNSIAGWTKILQGESLTDSTKRRAINTIEKNIRLQSDLVEELLEFTKITSDNVKLNKEIIEFEELLKESISEFELTASDKEIEVVNEISLEGEKVNCERQIVKKAFKNLLDNAIKFTPKKGKIQIIAEKVEDIIRLRIKDSGQGIEKDLLPHVFDKFRQADSSTVRKYGGLGMGLAIARQIIRLHKGNITVKSDGKGKGTEFIVEIPFEQEKLNS